MATGGLALQAASGQPPPRQSARTKSRGCTALPLGALGSVPFLQAAPLSEAELTRAIKLKIGEKTAQELWLNIKARRHDQFAALFVDLEGTLDHLNARELLERIRQAAERAKLDIIINFEHLREATPAALQTLLDSEALKAVAPYAKVRYRKFKVAFQAALGGLSLNGLEMLEEDWQDA